MPVNTSREVCLMSSERIDVPSKSLYVRKVPDQPRHIAHPDFDNSDRSGFSNSTIDRGAYPFADRPNTRDFDAMLAAYMWSGGIARHQEVITRLEEDGHGGPSSLGKLIDSRAVFAFDWRGSLWLPWRASPCRSPYRPFISIIKSVRMPRVGRIFARRFARNWVCRCKSSGSLLRTTAVAVWRPVHGRRAMRLILAHQPI